MPSRYLDPHPHPHPGGSQGRSQCACGRGHVRALSEEPAIDTQFQGREVVFDDAVNLAPVRVEPQDRLAPPNVHRLRPRR